jgi:hypothetical protein
MEPKAISRAIARSYDDVKYPDRGHHPGSYELSLLTPLLLLIAFKLE